MTNTPLQRKIKTSELLFSFNNSEDLTQGILFLYKKKPFIKSSLYKNNSVYHLIITADDRWPIIRQLLEFANFKTKNYILIAKTREYYNPILLGSAVEIYGKAFFKEI